MNVLFVVPYVPDLIRVRPYNLIRHLSDRGHRVTVMTLWTNEQERDSLRQLGEYCDHVWAVYLPGWRSFWNSLIALPSRTPLQSVYCWHPALARMVVELSSRRNGRPGFDVIHIEHLRGARYGVQLKSNHLDSNSEIPVIWDSVDSISALFRQAIIYSKSAFGRWLTRLELGRTESYEGWLISQFDRVLVTSSADKRALLAQVDSEQKQDKITILRNGVDLNYFTPDDHIPRESATLVVSGKMSYHANVTMSLHLVNQIMPRVWSVRDDVRVIIVGKDPPRSIRSLAQDPRITVTGTVKDIRSYLQRATLATAPLTYGTGVQNKVLEAMACATPVVATPQAVSALDVRPGEELMVARNSTEFAQAILELLNDPLRGRKIGQDGRSYVEKHHQWREIVVQLEEIYQQAINSKRRTPSPDALRRQLL